MHPSGPELAGLSVGSRHQSATGKREHEQGPDRRPVTCPWTRLVPAGERGSRVHRQRRATGKQTFCALHLNSSSSAGAQ